MTQRITSVVISTLFKELRLLYRDLFCVALLACFSIGLAWSVWNSQSHWRGFSMTLLERQAAEREKWLSQSTTNAHMATHVGQTVFKPISPLAGFDSGALLDFGSKIFLESHHQSVARELPRESAVELLQSEVYSPAVLLGLVGPLLIIVLANASIAREKDGGTLSLLLSTGSPWGAIVLGKGMAILLALFLVALPGVIMHAIPWFKGSSLLGFSDLLVRQAVILASMTAYYIGWIGVSILVASKSSSMAGSFSVLIAMWSIFALVMPRVAGDVAVFVSPIPTNAEIRIEKENAVQTANQSTAERAKANQDLEARLLEEFQVDRIEDLPIEMAGARMIASEDQANRLYDEIDDRITRAIDRQIQIIAGFQFVSPYLALRTVSASLSATDRTHHFDFVNAAEDHRRRFVKHLNRAEMNKQSPGSTPEERRRFWGEVPEFVPGFVSAEMDIKHSASALICIAIWAVAAGVAALCFSLKIKPAR